jgi:xanthosine utilization system XapX-like protein
VKAGLELVRACALRLVHHVHDRAHVRRPAEPLEPTLARALTLPQSPGPEGLAEQFAYKVATGVFGRDLSAHLRPAGRAVHLAYGAAWGMLYGLLQASYPRPPVPFGAAYGLVVWLVGPAFLVPAMRLIGRPSEEPVARTAALVAGHVAYGLALAATFEALRRDGR